MKEAERGFLLLTCPLGDPLRKPLTVAQFRTLADRVRNMDKPTREGELSLGDLQRLGYEKQMAYRILHLLSQEDLLEYYIKGCERAGAGVMTRITDWYPALLRQKLDPDSPASLWFKGDLSLLGRPAIALVGSREIAPENRSFAWEVGTQAAKQGYVLISGNARGADRMAQTACRRAGGEVIVVAADELEKHKAEPGMLFISEEGFDLPFSAQRALHRNRIIHALGEKTFVAQCGNGVGGTWDGTVYNLKNGLSPVFCFRDGSDAMTQLAQMGAQTVDMAGLQNFKALSKLEMNLFDL